MSSREIEQIYSQWRDVLENRHIIAAIRNIDALAAVVESPTEVVYLLFGNPLNLGELIRRVRDNGKLPLVNLDLLSGFSRDAINAEYLAVSGAAGVVSTHGEVLRASRKQEKACINQTPSTVPDA